MEVAILYDSNSESVRKQLTKMVGKDKVDAALKKLPKINAEYDAWYSEAMAVVRQLLPDRQKDFVSFYEKPKGRKTIQYGNYVMQDYLQGLRTTDWSGETKVDKSAAIPQFQQQLAILMAAKSRLTSSLYEIRQIVQADLFDSEVAAARELLKYKFLRAAGAIAGVVLEKHLLQVCVDHSIKVAKKDPGISDLNDLLKAASTIDVPQWRHISMLADLRNLCAHNKKQEPTVVQVTDLIDGVDKVLKTIS